MTLCNTCKKANKTCPVYPLDTDRCVEYVASNDLLSAEARIVDAIDILAGLLKVEGHELLDCLSGRVAVIDDEEFERRLWKILHSR